MTNYDRHPDEETPLLQSKLESKTPLPWRHLSPILLALFAEPVASAYIFPFINQLIGELGITGGDDRKIGYYAGLIESLFFVTQALASWQWSRLSDFIGRRPVILIGLLGLSVSNLAFGLSRTLPMLIISRCIAGLLNGNVGVMKSMLGDITDDTNMAQVFSLVPCIFMVGFAIAPLFGGMLVKPQEQWPYIFRGEFWAIYPYFLPSLISGCFTLLAFIVCVIFMQESLPSKIGTRPRQESLTAENSPDERPLPMLTLLKTPSVIIPVANYGTLALAEISFYALLPLVYSAPIEIGGLGFPPSIIGIVLATFGILNGIVQALFTSKLVERFGAKNVFCWAVLAFYPLILLFPIISAVVATQGGGVGPIVWILIVLQLVFLVLMDIAFPVIFILTTRAAPNKQSLGSTNGLSQSLTSIARAIGPASITSLFAASKEHNLLGGNLVYVVPILIATFWVMISRRLKDDDKNLQALE
ncbi:MFS general substrate transporter [Chiua virens]|nr:MFS general substrate transporter [Chiua virens]